MVIFSSFIALLFFTHANALETSKSTLNLKFVIPGYESTSFPTISTKLSMVSTTSPTAYKSIRSILHVNNIIMDCTFNFDSNTFQSSTQLICDTNTACITSSTSQNEMYIHFENLGVGDLQISEIKKQKQMLYNKNNNNFIINNNNKYIDFRLSKTNKLYPITSKIHPNSNICNPKNFIYNHENDNKNGRKLLVSHLYNDEVYGSYTSPQQYTGINNGHAEYMDIILTIVFLILIVISVFNMSYAFNCSFTPKYVDTRRV